MPLSAEAAVTSVSTLKRVVVIPTSKKSPLEERVRHRILGLMERLDVRQKALAAGTHISQSVMSKLLSGQQRITLEYLEEFCFFFQKTPSEFVAEAGATFVNLKEMEGDLLERFREMDDKERRALLDVLDWRLKKQPQRPTRRRQ